MDLTAQAPDENIRKIEDIIDIQKANGSYSIRQVAFSLTSDGEGTCVKVAECAAAPPGGGGAARAGLARSLESGLGSRRDAGGSLRGRERKKQRSKRHTSPLPDVVSWPSDSDITVLRMKLCLASEAATDAAPGDGLHRRNSSSMVNLATLMLHSQTPSKRSLNLDEYLLPLTSWERGVAGGNPAAAGADAELVVCAPSSKGSNLFARVTRKARLARFLRLYFCPCCTCLYELETMRRESPSVYLTKPPSRHAD